MKKGEVKKKKVKHGRLGEVVDKKKMNSEENLDIQDTMNIASFENYCGACDNFETEECPFFGKVFAYTDRHKLRCENFWD